MTEHQDAGAPRWSGPGDFGAPAAFAAMTGVAAPLLAGFSLTLLGVVAQAPGSFRWPGLSISVLVMVCASLVASVQFGFRGRAVLYSKSDVEAWGRLSEEPADVELRLRTQVQIADMASWRLWYRRSQLTYNFGLTLLALALALVAAPPKHYGSSSLSLQESMWRWTGCGLAVLAALAELSWIIGDELRAYRTRRDRRGLEFEGMTINGT